MKKEKEKEEKEWVCEAAAASTPSLGENPEVSSECDMTSLCHCPGCGGRGGGQ